VHLPTTALLEDMHARFAAVGTMLNFTCCYLGSTQQDLSVSAKAARGDYQIVLATTERFSTFIPNHAGFINPTITIAAEFFDETHVILDADDHFRPLFLTINDIPRRGDGFRVLRGAFTATVEADNLGLILAHLPLQNAKIIKVDPARHNMNLECSPKAIGDGSKEADCAKMYNLIRPIDGKVIIFTVTTGEADDLTAALNLCRPNVATTYHGKLKVDKKQENALLWDKGERKVW
jgi:superfamily II DNA helicase RecQ